MQRMSLDAILSKLKSRHFITQEDLDAPMELPRSLCSCPTPHGCYGLHGWHWRPNPEYPHSPQMSIMYESCPTYEPRRSTKYSPGIPR